MLFGMIISGKIIDSYSKIIRLVLTVILLAVSICGLFLVTEKGYPQMATGDVGNFILYFIIASAASVGVIILSQLISGYSKFIKPLIWFGQNSMAIFIIHRTMVYVCKSFYNTHNSIIVCLIVWIMLAVYSSIVAMIINKFCPAIVGKYKFNRRNVK